jgi:DNA-binding MarR family transcriptional regulator
LTLARVCGIADPAAVDDPAYAEGLRSAVSVALTHAITALEEVHLPSVPAELLSQARCAARHGVPLDTVVRRYVAGHALLGDFILAMAEGRVSSELGFAELRRALRIETVLLDNLIVAVAREFTSEIAERSRSASQRRAERVRMLLEGQPIDASELSYELDAWHIGALAYGPGAGAALRDLAAVLDRRLLVISPGGKKLWAWLGGRNRLPATEVARLAIESMPTEASIALGEPGSGLEGWRRSHRQAKAAAPVAERQGMPVVVCYADVALLATALRDDILAESLQEVYLNPLAGEGDDGVSLRKTLEAYFASGRNVSSAAALLGISRPTVTNRIRRAEEKVGRSLDACAPEIETALRLHRFL